MVTLNGLDNAFNLLAANGIKRPKGSEPMAVMKTWGRTFHEHTDEELALMMQEWLETDAKGFWPSAPQVLKKRHVLPNAPIVVYPPISCVICQDTGITQGCLVQANDTGEFVDLQVYCYSEDCEIKTDRAGIPKKQAETMGYTLIVV